MSDDRTPPSPPTVAFQGELGAFSEEGIIQLWAGRATPVPHRDFDAVARSVGQGDVDYGLLPIENTLAGSVIASYDALASNEDLHIVGETVVAIHHCLLALPGTAIDELLSVASHPVALAQCGDFLRGNPQLDVRSWYDTAGAARDLAAKGNRAAAAIAGRRAAVRYSLDIVVADIEDRHDNQTRFVALARVAAAPEAGAPARTALVLETDNEPGALLRVLTPIANEGINLSKLESRPTGEPWSYRFFVEMEHAAGAAALDRCLDRMRAASRALRVLGTYAI
ncbi:MAG: prephenate dehydratase [Gemmatimonadaceae bacterium]